jgi:hypothetical protein
MFSFTDKNKFDVFFYNQDDISSILYNTIYEYGCGDYAFYAGIEVEFYLKNSNANSMLYLIEYLLEYSNTKVTNVVSKPNYKPTESDYQGFIISKDLSLPEKDGYIALEVSTPKFNLVEIDEYFDLIFSLSRLDNIDIETDDSCGLHFHLSTSNKNTTINIIKYMALLYETDFLDSWPQRGEYNVSIKKLFEISNLEKIRENKVKVGRNFSINFKRVVAPHIEIRAMGGKSYFDDDNIEIIVSDLIGCFEIFINSMSEDDQSEKEYKEIIEKNHLIDKNISNWYKILIPLMHIIRDNTLEDRIAKANEACSKIHSYINVKSNIDDDMMLIENIMSLVLDKKEMIIYCSEDIMTLININNYQSLQNTKEYRLHKDYEVSFSKSDITYCIENLIYLDIKDKVKYNKYQDITYFLSNYICSK